MIGFDRKRFSQIILPALMCWLMIGSHTAQAQVDYAPRVVDVHERSGLFTRLQPFNRPLPHDPHRDTFYGTKYDDRPDSRRPNDWKHGGLYGQYWEPTPARSMKPYFRGAPGVDTITPDKAPALGLQRWVSGITEPFRPVKYYYQSGSYVPVYDLDPLVTGPGTFPWPFFYKEKHGG